MKKPSPAQIIANKVDGLSLRERAILLGVGFIVLTIGCIQFAIEPINKEIHQKQENIHSKNIAADDIETQLKILEIEYGIDPNEALYKEQAYLEQALTKVEKQLDAAMFSLVTPKRMVSVIRDLFSTGNDIDLLSMENLPPQSVFVIVPKMPKAPSADNTITTEGAMQTSNETTNSDSTPPELEAQELFQHGIEVRFEADFFTVLAYLETLEALKWRFYWHKLHYEVKEYPIATVTLEIHTFSREAGVLGV